MRRLNGILLCVYEVCLCVLILSVVVGIISSVNPFGAAEFAKNTLINFFGEFDIFKYWLNLLDGAFSLSTVSQGLYGMIFSAAVNSLLVSFCIRVCKEIVWTFANGVTFLPTMVGTILGCELLIIIPRLISDNLIVLSYILKIAIIIIGILIMTRVSLHAFSLSGLGLILLELLPDAFAAAAVTEYLVALSMVMTGKLTPPVPWIIGSAIVTIVVLILVYILSRTLEQLRRNQNES